MQYSTSAINLAALLGLVCAMSACSRKPGEGPDSAPADSASVAPPPASVTEPAPELQSELQSESLPASTGTIADLMGPQWKLQSYDDVDPIAPDVSITLAVDVDKLSGQGGCNRYMGSVANGDGPGKLVVGPMALTKMACGPSADAAEMRYMAALQRATSFSVHGRQLLLTYVDGETTRKLIYTR